MPLRLNVNDHAPHFAEEFATDESKIVVLALEVLIQHYHLRKTIRHEAHGVNAGEFAHETLAEPGYPHEGVVVDAAADIETAEEIFVADRHFTEVLVGLHVLNVGLNQRVQVTHLGDE